DRLRRRRRPAVRHRKVVASIVRNQARAARKVEKRILMPRPLITCLLIMLATRLQAQGPVIAPTPNLVADGIPKIPAAIAADVRRYTEYRSANLVDWHPTRRELLISTRFANAPQL